LGVALSELRVSLGAAAGCLIADREHVGVAADRVWVDALQFGEPEARGQSEAAVELWYGELLPELDDDWVLEARDAHAAALIDALSRPAAAREASGDLGAAISLSRRMVAVDPLSEAGTRELMRRLASAGERGGAIASYRRLAGRLSSQLRIAPGATTRALADELLATETGPAAEAYLDAVNTSLELAVSHYEQALERAAATNQGEARRGELLIGLGEAQSRAGRAGQARASHPRC
jgi:DNA-binding SARP family transcriptional activator